jgi:hypothetical protein
VSNVSFSLMYASCKVEGQQVLCDAQRPRACFAGNQNRQRAARKLKGAGGRLTALLALASL